MKLQEINTIIEETVSSEIKSRILKEQEDTSQALAQIKTFDSLAPLQDKITRVEGVITSIGFEINRFVFKR